MKKFNLSFLLSALMLGCVSLFFVACGDDNDDDSTGGDGIQDPELVLTVDANGNITEGHTFWKIDDSNLYVDAIKYTIENDQLVVTGYDPMYFEDKATIIDALKYNGKKMPVVRIGARAFYECYGLKSVRIPSSVTVIDSLAFAGTSLPSVTIPNGVKTIKEGAFVRNDALTSIKIPASVTSIGSYAFSGKKLVSMEVDGNNKVYDSRGNCNAIVETKTNTLRLACQRSRVHTTVTTIGAYAFDGLNITEITIPESVAEIDSFAFFYCENLSAVTLSNGLKKIGNNAFGFCRELTSINLPTSLTSIGEYAFYGSGLTSVVIPKNVKTVEKFAFCECYNLQSATLSEGVTTIREGAFAYCVSLQTVTLPSTMLSLEIGVFEGSGNIQDVYCYATVPPRTDEFDISQNATLHVPAESVQAYSYSGWWLFGYRGGIVAL